MRRFLYFLVALCCVGLTSVGIAWAVTPSVGHTVTGGETRVVHYYASGVGGSCDGDSCSVGEVNPLTFELPASPTPYSGTITMSFTYSTQGDGLFSIGSWVTIPGDDHHIGRVLPFGRTLDRAPHATGRTFVFRVLGVPGGEPLQLHVGAGIGERGRPDVGFGASQLLVELRVSTS